MITISVYLLQSPNRLKMIKEYAQDSVDEITATE